MTSRTPAIHISQAGVTVTSGAASANVAIPPLIDTTIPRMVRLVSDTACYLKFVSSNVGTTDNTGILITNTPVILYVTPGFGFIAYLQATAAAKLNITPLDDY